MASTKVIIVVSAVLLCFMLLQVHHLAEAEEINFTTQANKGSYPSNINCGAACKGRCELSSRPNLCHRACGTCCARCSCVPPGTSGNHQVCPCYATMTTHNGRLKCP